MTRLGMMTGAALALLGALAAQSCNQRSPAQTEGARLQNEDGQPGCAIDGVVKAVSCSGGWCLVCYEIQLVPNDQATWPQPNVCVSFDVAGCR